MNTAQKRTLPFLLCFFFCANYGRAQSSDTTSNSTKLLPFNSVHTSNGIVLGIHQFNHTFFELGFVHAKSKGGCMWGSFYKATSLGVEYNPFQQNIGVTLSRWNSVFSFLIVGANAHSYSDFKQFSFGFKPFIGIGSGVFGLTYGYNFELISPAEYLNINKHCFSLRIVVDFN